MLKSFSKQTFIQLYVLFDLPEVLVLLPVEVVLQDGHQLCHLTEEKDSVTGSLQLGEYTVKELKLSRCPEQC